MGIQENRILLDSYSLRNNPRRVLSQNPRLFQIEERGAASLLIATPRVPHTPALILEPVLDNKAEHIRIVICSAKSGTVNSTGVVPKIIDIELGEVTHVISDVVVLRPAGF